MVSAETGTPVPERRDGSNVVAALKATTLLLLLLPGISNAATLIPPVGAIQSDHPRILLRPETSSYAVSIEELRESGQRDDAPLLSQLRSQNSVAAQAMVWLLTGETAMAERAISTMRGYRQPEDPDTFHVYFTLMQFALAYDWLYNHPAFTPEAKAEVRSRMLPLAERGLRYADDHMFHNYIWMSAGGVALWALATAGEDAGGDHLLERVRQRFNAGLFPAWKYLDGLPSEPLGYWTLYVFAPGVLTLLGVQSAFETDVVGRIRDEDGGWLDRHFENLIHSTLPDMRYIPWGDLQSGPNGGVTSDVAGIVDAVTWATRSPRGAYFSDWLAQKRGLRRFRADTAIFYFLYGRQQQPAPVKPALSFMAGNGHSGHFIARSGWEEDATIVTLRIADHFGDHHHYDQGSFTIYRNGLLAVDPPVYQKVAGPQQPTAVHNTLLIDGKGQRPARGQWFKTVADFQKNLQAGRLLETGDMLFWKDEGSWAAAAGQFAQAYWPTQVQSCVRQLLFVRPNKVLIVDQLLAPSDAAPLEVNWLLQLPETPKREGSALVAGNGKSWLRCQPLLPEGADLQVESTEVRTYRVSLSYRGGRALSLAHLLEIGDGAPDAIHSKPAARLSDRGISVKLADRSYLFSNQLPFGVSETFD